MPLGMVCLILLLASWHWEVGVRGGVPVTNSLATESGPATSLVYGVEIPFAGFRSTERRYTVGPTVGLGLWRGFQLQVDALYNRLGYESALAIINTPSSGAWAMETWVRAAQWRFPAQVRYRWGRLTVGGGMVLSRIVAESERYRSTRRGLFDRQAFVGEGVSERVEQMQRRNGLGVVASVGAAWRRGPLRICPELRYTRITRRTIDGAGPGGFIHNNANQFEILVAITAGRGGR